MAPSLDEAELDVQRSPSPPGRGRSVSPTEGTHVHTIPEDDVVSEPPPQPSSPRRQEPGSPRGQELGSPRGQQVERSDSNREQPVDRRGNFLL